MAKGTSVTSLDDVPRVSDQEYERVWNDLPGLWGMLTTVQNTPLGMRFIAVSLLFFVLAVGDATLMRLQTSVPQNPLVDPNTYNRLFTMHGSTMMFLFVIPLTQGLATLILPQMLGVRELPFPRLTAFAFWTFFFGGLLYYSSVLLDAPNGGWFAYTPLTGPEYSPDKGMDFWLLGLNVAEIGAIAGAMELIIAFFKTRALGMTFDRVPILAWAFLVQGFMMIFGFTPLVVGSAMLEMDRKLGTQFFNPEAGGDALLWQHIFWIFGHPEVYIQFIPAAGILSTVIPVFSRRRLVGYRWIVLSMISIGFFSFALWAHHMFTVGMPELSLVFFSISSMMIAIPSGIQLFAWIATLWTGRPIWTTSLLFAVGGVVLFVLGGITGVMVSAVPFDMQVHDTYFVVAHFHYVLLGGVVFPIFAALYYWAPKYLPRMLDERLGKLNFWLMFAGMNIAFFPMHIVGLLGMPRRIYTYLPGLGWDGYNVISAIGVGILVIGMVVFVVNLVTCLLTRPVPTDPNPWNADTLEWGTPTPTPQYGWRDMPIIRSRHPLWDQKELHEGDGASGEQTEALVDAMARWPLNWRSQLVVSSLDAEPEELIHIPTSSIWPLVMALSLMGSTFLLIFDWNLLALVALIPTVVGLVAWQVDNWKLRAADTTLDEEFEARFGIPVHSRLSHSVFHWAVWLTGLTLGIILGTLVFSYLYLRLNFPAWPPEGIAMPGWLIPGIGTLLLLVGAVVLGWAGRALRRGDRGRLRGSLALALLLSVAHIALLVLSYFQMGITPQVNAYGSIVFATLWFQVLVAAGVLLIGGIALYHTLLRDYHRDYQSLALDAILYAAFAAASGVIVFVTLYVLPQVL